MGRRRGWCACGRDEAAEEVEKEVDEETKRKTKWWTRRQR
jgi:hypothetical protein